METPSIQHRATCHCGFLVQFMVRLTDEYNTVRRCTCSYCSMRGAVAVSAKLDEIEFVKGEGKLTLYQFNTKAAKHFFVPNAGSIPTISGVLTRMNLALTLRVWRGFRPSILLRSRCLTG